MSTAPFRAVCLLMLWATTGCESDSKNASNEGECSDVDGLQTCRYTTTTSSSSGLASIDIRVNDSAGAFLVTARAKDGLYMSTEQVVDPDGDTALSWDDWYYGDNNLTAGILPMYRDTHLNWPVRDDDTQLFNGVWSVDLAVIDFDGYYMLGERVELVTQVKQDDDLSVGNVNARIVYVDGLDTDAEVTAGTEAAVEVWREIWGAYGLTLTVSYATATEVSAELPSMVDGGADIETISLAGTDDDFTVVIGESVGGTFEVYGESGGIPGTLVANEHAAVAISWITNAGGDGVFSDDDIRVYGETLAHELGHYMGLFHPVDYDARYAPFAWDALSDTDECRDLDDCDVALGDNNMYPFPVCPSFDNCTFQQVLSTDQAAVLHRHTGAL